VPKSVKVLVMRVRKIKTGSGKFALQVVSGVSGNLKIHKHIGSYSNKFEMESLLGKAKDYIEAKSGQENLFSNISNLNFSEIAILESKPLFAYNFLSSIYSRLGFDKFGDEVLKDLVIARIFAPSSKNEARDFLFDSFERKYSLKTIYRHLKDTFDDRFKEFIQDKLIDFAKKDLGDSLRLILYDVTTLYFDSQAKVGLKDFGFSKDHRPSDTQVVVGLVTNKDGFPLYFDVFKGNTFEGHTFLVTIEKVIKLLNNPKIIVVADAGMLSKINIEDLDKRSIGFIVGARVSNLPATLINKVSKRLNKKDRKASFFDYNNFRLVCQYLTTRANKDRSDRQKQVQKAQNAINKPSEVTSRFRFLKKSDEEKYIINQDLILKSEKLEGIKGYITNTKLTKKEIIEKYHNLWRIENCFRVTKSDLEARPIFHHLDETIKAHLVIVFAGLAITRFIEIKTNLSIKKVIKTISKVLTHKVKNIKTGEHTHIETQIENPQLLKDLEIIKLIRH